MESKDRLTAQGIRDLNYYGPRKPRVSEATADADTAPDAPVAVPPTEAPPIANETAGPDSR